MGPGTEHCAKASWQPLCQVSPAAAAKQHQLPQTVWHPVGEGMGTSLRYSSQSRQREEHLPPFPCAAKNHSFASSQNEHSTSRSEQTPDWGQLSRVQGNKDMPIAAPLPPAWDPGLAVGQAGLWVPLSLASRHPLPGPSLTLWFYHEETTLEVLRVGSPPGPASWAQG